MSRWNDGLVKDNYSSCTLETDFVCPIISRKTTFCINVQYDKKCDLLVQCDKKMIQCDRIVVNDAIIVTCLLAQNTIFLIVNCVFLLSFG